MPPGGMKVHGACHCGRISFEAVVDPERVTICHCTDCQQLTGTAYRVSVPADAGVFHLLAGSPAIYEKLGQSGARRAQAFCANCGSPLYTHAAGQPVPASYGLRVGCLDERRQLPPKKQKWCSSALPWSMDIAELPQSAQE